MPVDSTWSIIIAALGAIATAAGATAAFGAWKAASRSNTAATILADIERARWHTELTPRFDATCYRAATGDGAQLTFVLTGPTGLDRLDSVVIAIRDDRSNRTPLIAGGATADDLARVLWGPMRFRPHVDGADKDGRRIPSFPMARLETKPFTLEPSLVPKWMDGDVADWRRRYVDHPVRLALTCTRDGHKEWNVELDVPIETREPTADVPSP